MKVKLNKEMINKFSFHIGGDLSESVAIAVNFEGEPISYKEFIEKGGNIKPIHVLSLEEEFLVVDHDRPITKRDFDIFKEFFVRED